MHLKKCGWMYASLLLMGALTGFLVLAAYFFQSKEAFYFTKGEEPPALFEYNRKTYVRFDHPLVYLTVILADECGEATVCNTETVLQDIRANVTYGIVMRELSEKSSEAQNLIKSLSLKYLPAFLLSKSLAEVSTFTDLQTKGDLPYFTDVGDYYLLDYASRTKPAKIIGLDYTPPLEKKNDKVSTN